MHGDDMSEAHCMSRPPRRILLATDLSPRCDRALDRAIQLADQWQAKLVILNVLEKPDVVASDATTPSWRRPPDACAAAEKRLVDDAGPAVNNATIMIEEGDPAETILTTAAAEECDLIVTGIARDELLGRFFLGTTVDRLIRNSSVPVLVVKNRARRPYHHIVVATDFSEPSRHALETADRYFPGSPLTIFHAFDAPMSTFAADAAAYRRDRRHAAEQAYKAFLESLPSAEAIRKRAKPLIEFGSPSHLLQDYIRDKGIDLLVLGTHGRGAILDILIGSVAKQIMADLPCDTLVVRAPEGAAT